MSREETNGKKQNIEGAHQVFGRCQTKVAEPAAVVRDGDRVVSTARLGLVPLRLDDMDFLFADNNIVVMENTTIVELIESAPEGPLLTVSPIPIVTTVVKPVALHIQ